MRPDKLAKRLAVLPKSRICPHCGEMKIESRRWIALDTFLGCKQCWIAAGRPSGAKLTHLAKVPKRLKRKCPWCEERVESELWDDELKCCKACAPDARKLAEIEQSVETLHQMKEELDKWRCKTT